MIISRKRFLLEIKKAEKKVKDEMERDMWIERRFHYLEEEVEKLRNQIFILKDKTN